MEPEEIAKLFRGIYEDLSINDLERSLYEGNWPAEGPPDPNTSHPALSHAAEFVRNFDRQTVQIAGMVRTPWADKEATYPTSESVPINKALLTRSKACGPAPFIGDPRLVKAIYVWPIWSDKYHRHIAGDAELIWGVNDGMSV